MAETFPASLAQKLLESGFSYDKGSTVVRSSNDTGPNKVRRRFTAPINTIAGSIELNLNDFNTLEEFYDTTLNGGVKTFNYNHPITGVVTEFRFLTEYNMIPIGGEYFLVNFQWEIIP